MYHWIMLNYMLMTCLWQCDHWSANMNNLPVLLSQSVSILTHSSYDISQIIFGNWRWSRRIYAYKNQFFDYTFIRIRMICKNIEVRGSNSIQESCISSVESTVPEHLDAGINNGDDSFETWVSIVSNSGTEGGLEEFMLIKTNFSITHLSESEWHLKILKSVDPIWSRSLAFLQYSLLCQSIWMQGSIMVMIPLRPGYLLNLSLITQLMRHGYLLNLGLITQVVIWWRLVSPVLWPGPFPVFSE